MMAVLLLNMPQLRNKMGKNIIFFIVALLLGFVVIRQINAKQNVISIMDSSKTAVISQEVAELIKGNQKLRGEYATLEEQNINLSSASTDSNQTDETLSKELSKLKIISGETSVSGQGVEITFKEDIEQTQIVDLINALRNIGIEALAIGAQRIIVNTPISSNLIAKNTKIEVIGNQDILYDSLLRRGGIIEQIGADVSIDKKNIIILTKTNG